MSSTVISNNNSDYTKPSTDLYNLLPEPYRSDTNRAVLSNLFNRYLSKDETTQIIGYVGDGNPNAVFVRKIVEPTVHRAGWQLQPLMYSKIGSIEFITSWYDILDELTAQGINIDNQPEWLNATLFNWAPPIDINKIVNYQDYYWYDTGNPNSQPQYITVKSVCAQATALVTYMQNLISQFGASFDIIKVLPSVNAIQVLGDQTLLFDAGFLFYVQGTSNTQLNNSFQTVVSSSYDAAVDTTTIVVGLTLTDSTPGGQITLEQQLQVYENLQACECSNASGWDTQPWDDNQPNQPPPVWNAAVLSDISYPTLPAWLTAHPAPELSDIWYDTTGNALWQLTNPAAASSLSSWFKVYSNFSLVLQQTTGTAYWDLSTGCAGSAATIAGMNQWISENKWVHKSDVANFTVAKRAQAPIIEFEPQLELNEWTYTSYSWQYRASQAAAFAPTTAKPSRFELEPINLYSLQKTQSTTPATYNDTFVLDERFGDLSGVFTPGFGFTVAGSNAPYIVAESYYYQPSAGSAFNTYVVVTEPFTIAYVPAKNWLQPETTSQGDAFLGYGQQWLFSGIDTTVAVNHQFENAQDDPSTAPIITDPSGLYTTQTVPYAEQFTLLKTGVTTLTLSAAIPVGSSRSLQQRSLVGFNDVRVYLNGVRQYGNYDEDGTIYVTGVTFHTPLSTADIVKIVVGEAAYSDFGNYAVPVRTVASDSQYSLFGDTVVSLIGYRKAEQIKTAANQYPLFDLYQTNSETANIANEIFGYHEAPNGVLYPYLSARVVTRADGSLEFINELVQTRNGKMYAYRNYNRSQSLYWYNPVSQILYVWTGNAWATKYIVGGYYTAPIVADALPDPATVPLGTVVFNTTTNTLYERTDTVNSWTVEPSVTIAASDTMLQTVWRHGLGNEQAVPAPQDWFRRSYAEYEQQRTAYISTTEQQLQITDPSLTAAQAAQEADTMWTAMQNRWINPAWYLVDGTQRNGPLWCGQWQVPDPMYYNVSHENYQYVSQRDLLTHFQSIVDSQPLFPGFSGQPSANWNLIAYQDVNYGLGGTIHEYDNSFDTFLSAEYTNVVTPATLFGFAQSEYENIIVTLGQTMQRQAVSLLTQTDTTTILTPQVTIANAVITAYEENEAANLVYGDSTTYTQAQGSTPATGVMNWIATLPYFGIVPAVQPVLDFDPKRGINAIVHHDGHRSSYTIPTITANALQLQIVNTIDSRITSEKIGRISANPPPATQSEFIAEFSANLRTGVYWLQTSSNTLYRMVAFVQPTAPPTDYPAGTFWWNTEPATGAYALSILENNAWVGFSLTDISAAWQPVNLSEIYAEVVLQAEQKLYENVPTPPASPPIDFAALESANQTAWDQMLLQQFNNYVREKQISSPLANSLFDPTDPWTWNYKYSTTTKEPRSGTIPSGGTWQDVYQKAYFTPYPHLEPWALQRYTQKPTWWDAKFVNDNPLIYGTRYWKYVHNLPVVSVATNVMQVGVQNYNQAQIFKDFQEFTVYTATNSFTYSVQSVTFAAGYVTITTTQPIDASVDNTATIAVGLWDYIIRGATPSTAPTPAQQIPVYAYVSVNISSTQTFIDGTQTYGSDDLLPPYWNVSAHSSQLTLPQDATIRSLFTDTTFEVISENADYNFGDEGPVEWAWRNSSFYSYALLTMAYMLQPVKTLQAIFGTVYQYIDSLPIDSLTSQVFSHTLTNFHGEISTSNQLVKVNGINQWYINYLRANGYDTSYSDFRTMWTQWTAPLAYQFDATIDTTSFQINHRAIEIAPADYELTMKRSPAVSNAWVDAFNIQVESMPPIQSLFDAQNQWVLNVDSLAPITRTISYYGARLYDYYADSNTSTCTLWTYPIVAANPVERSFTVGGDVSSVFGPNGTNALVVTNAAGNNGTYSVVSATYNSATIQTVIVVSEVVASPVAAGLITADNYRTLPWVTGDLVSLETTELAPLPLNTSLQYFLIVLSPTTFQLAMTKDDAIANIPIAFASVAYGIQRVGQVSTTFTALNAQNTPIVWRHYALDKTVLNTFTTPYRVIGMQNWINIFDGYVSYIADQGFGVNVEGAYTDPLTGQQVSWQNELERFINWAYLQRTSRRQRINDKYQVSADLTNSQFTYVSQNPEFPNGSSVVVWAFGGALPSPLITGQTYFIFTNQNGTVSLAGTRADALKGVPIALKYNGTTGNLYISAANVYLAQLPTYEINAFRNALWYSPPEGIVSNVVTGPFADITTQQLLFDQYGRKLTPGDIRVFRQDKLAQIQFASGVYNDVISLHNTQNNPYLYLHLGGGNIFVDTYEHVILFNDYTSAGALLYDSFLGVNVTKYELDFYRQTTENHRPNVGGYFLSKNYNQGANLVRNLEATVSDLRYAYDTYEVPETLPIVKRARASLDYPGTVSYLQEINLTPKSQFLFWKGMLKAKGSVNAITAFVNSRLFVSANADQFWAYQVAEFGSSAEQNYFGLLLQTQDTQTNELRLEFISSDEICLPGYAVETFGDENCGYANPESGSILTFNVDPTFTPILSTDTTRWWNQPDQLAALQPDGGVLSFVVTPQKKLVVYPVTIGPTTFVPYGQSVVTDPSSPLYPANLTDEVAVIAYDASNNLLDPSQQAPYTFWYWVPSEGGYWAYGGRWDPSSQNPIFRHNFQADLTQITFSWYDPGYTTSYTVPATPTNTTELSISPYLPLTNSLQVFENGTLLQPGVDYVESLEYYPGSTILGYQLYFQESISGSTINVIYGSSQLYESTQYNIINTNILELTSQEIVAQMFLNNYALTLWGLLVDKQAQNPAKIIDEAAEVVLSPVTFWDPARGYQFYQTLHSIDIQTSSDPAIYDQYDGWKDAEVGKTWLDTTNVKYVPYYDPNVLTDQDTRLGAWGNLTDYGNVRIFQWVKSPVAPADYNTLAAAQENDSSIDPSVRLSGTVRQDVRSRTRSNSTVQVNVAGAGQSIVAFSSAPVTSDATNLVSSTSYSFTIAVNGLTRTITITGSEGLNFGALVATLNTRLNPLGASIALSGSLITISSNTVGSTSTVVLTSDALFTVLPNYVGTSTIAGVDQSIQVANITPFLVGQAVMFSSTGTLPTGLVAGVQYTIAAITGNTITLTGVVLTDVGTGTLTMVSAVWPATWTIAQQVSCDLDPLVDAVSSTTNIDGTVTYTFNLANCLDPTQDYSIALFDAGATVNIYVNGVFNQAYTLTTAPYALSLTLNQADRVTVILPIYTPTVTDLAFDPAVSDNGSVITQWDYITNYNAVQTINTATNTQQFTYYFWVENVSVVPTNSAREAPVNAVEDLVNPPQPYMFFNKLAPPQTVTNASGQTVLLPDRFVQAIVNGLRGYVDGNNRYVLRFTRDFTLRDSLAYGTTPLELKDRHQEWLMFRRNQLGNIPRNLWDRITESMVGYLLTDPTVRVPSLDRQLYDAQNGASTQYGLGNDQAFVNGSLAKATILAYLNDPSNNFYPIDIEEFFSTYNFDTSANTITAMDAIYTTFGYTNVNNMFFSVLQDALTTQTQYAGLMKTSAVALYGVELLNANGIYDD